MPIYHLLVGIMVSNFAVGVLVPGDVGFIHFLQSNLVPLALTLVSIGAISN